MASSLVSNAGSIWERQNWWFSNSVSLLLSVASSVPASVFSILFYKGASDQPFLNQLTFKYRMQFLFFKRHH